MDTPTYEATITIGGKDQTTFFTKSLPDPREPDSGLITRQSGKIVLTLKDAAGVDFDASSLTNTDVYVVPFNSGTAPVLLGSGVISGSSNEIFTIEWDIDTIPASFSQFAQDEQGAIAMTFALEETGSDDFFQFATRFNVFDGDLAGDSSTVPLTPQTFAWSNAITSEWAKYGRGTPDTLVKALNYLSAAGKNDWGTVIDKDLVTSPAGVDNAQYIIAGTGGAWSGFTINDIVRYSATDSVWYRKTPNDGNFVFVADENLTYEYDGAAWNNQQATYTGEITGQSTLVIDKTAITNKSVITAASGDFILITDSSDSDNLKKVEAIDFAGNMNTVDYDPANISEQVIGESATQSMTNKSVNGVTLSTAGVSSQFLDATGTYSTPAGGGDMDTSTYDGAGIAEQLVGLVAVQILFNKTINGVSLTTAGLPTTFLNASGAYSTPAGGGDMSTAVYDPAAIGEQLVGLIAAQSLTNKSVNGVTLTTGGGSSSFLNAAGAYVIPAGAGDMLAAVYDAAGITEQLVGLDAVQVLLNKTVNGVVLDGSGAAGLFLNQAGNYITPAGGGDMTAAQYDPAGVTEQLAGLTATQSLTNKTINTVVLDGSGSSVLFLNQSGAYSSPTVLGVYRNLWMSAGAMIPNTTNGAESLTEETATNDIMTDIMAFDQTQSESVQFNVRMPDEWDLGTIKFKAYWTASSGAGTVTWGFSAGALSEGDAIDTALGSEIGVTDTLVSADDMHVTSATADVTVGGTPVLDDFIVIKVARRITDTLTADAKLLGVAMQYKELSTASAEW